MITCYMISRRGDIVHSIFQNRIVMPDIAIHLHQITPILDLAPKIRIFQAVSLYYYLI